MAVAVATITAAYSTTIHGQTHSGVNAQLYRPALYPFGVISIEGAQPLAQYDFGLKFSTGFAQSPLNIAIPGIGNDVTLDTETDSVLEYAANVNITLQFAFTKRLSFGFDVSILRTSPDDGYGKRGIYRDGGNSDPSTGIISLRPITNIDPSGGLETEGHSVPADVRLGFKYLIATGKLGIAALAMATVPFGDEEMFLGDRSFVFEPRVAVDYTLNRRSRIVANLGAKIRKRTVLEAFAARDNEMASDAKVVIDVGSEAFAGIGWLRQLTQRLSFVAEGTVFAPLPTALSYGSCNVSSGAACSSLANEDYFAGGGYGDWVALALAGINIRANEDTTLTLGGGSARLIGAGRGESYRFMIGAVWQPTPEGERALHQKDQDSDGVPDRLDICPDEPEDLDSYQDDDGCPDLDNDGDGVIDATDSCVDIPEDRDGYRDDDGCPERDNDDDGILDATDRCPNSPEDIDKFEDDDGCPDDDNDGDAFSDAKDQCPNEAETVNGFQDDDGCPDVAASGKPHLEPDGIDIQGARLRFTGARSARLNKASMSILDDVVTLLSQPANQQIKIRIEVHVPLGTSSSSRSRIARQKRADKELSRRRATTIRNYLIRKGVRASRLQAAGLGSDLPIRKPATSPRNDRTDFIRTVQ